MSEILQNTGVTLWSIRDDYDELQTSVFEALTGTGGKSNIRLIDEAIGNINSKLNGYYFEYSDDRLYICKKNEDENINRYPVTVIDSNGHIASKVDGSTINIDENGIVRGLPVDDALSSISTNPIQNKVVKAKVDEIEKNVSKNTEDISKNSTNISSNTQKITSLETAVSSEKTRAESAENQLKTELENGKKVWDDKYTKSEVDNKLSTLETNIDWKEAVSTYDDIATMYPNPDDGWTVNVKDTDYTYRYNGTKWVTISANAIPKATNKVDGLMTKEYAEKLDGLTKYTPDGTTITADEDGMLHGVSKIDVDDALSDESTNPVQNKAVNKAIESLKKSVSDGKIKVANAITGKGVTTATDATFDTMAKNISIIENNKSLILPDNAISAIASYDNKLIVSWNKPATSEIAIDKYNIYWSTNRPSSLKDFSNSASVNANTFEYTITGLTNGTVVYVVVESVSSEGYENASMRNLNSSNVGKPYFLSTRDSNPSSTLGTKSCVYSNDGKTWAWVTFSGTNPVWYNSNNWDSCSMIVFGDDKFYMLGQDGGTKIAYVYRVTNYNTSVKINSSAKYAHKIAYGNNNLVLGLSDSKMYYLLKDSQTFVAGELLTGTFCNISFVNGKFWLETYSNGGNYTSEDGKTWTQYSTNYSSTIPKLYVGGKYMSEYGYSYDGKTWVRWSISQLGKESEKIMLMGNTLFRLARNENEYTIFIKSTDAGATWSSVHTTTVAAYNNDYLYKNGILIFMSGSYNVPRYIVNPEISEWNQVTASFQSIGSGNEGFGLTASNMAVNTEKL